MKLLYGTPLVSISTSAFPLLETIMLEPPARAVGTLGFTSTMVSFMGLSPMSYSNEVNSSGGTLEMSLSAAACALAMV